MLPPSRDIPPRAGASPMLRNHTGGGTFGSFFLKRKKRATHLKWVESICFLPRASHVRVHGVIPRLLSERQKNSENSAPIIVPAE